MTTIGWGNIVPNTALGKICCVLYGVLGVPLFFTLASQVGDMINTGLGRLWGTLFPSDSRRPTFLSTQFSRSRMNLISRKLDRSGNRPLSNSSVTWTAKDPIHLISRRREVLVDDDPWSHGDGPYKEALERELDLFNRSRDSTSYYNSIVSTVDYLLEQSTDTKPTMSWRPHYVLSQTADIMPLVFMFHGMPEKQVMQCVQNAGVQIQENHETGRGDSKTYTVDTMGGDVISRASSNDTVYEAGTLPKDSAETFTGSQTLEETICGMTFPSPWIFDKQIEPNDGEDDDGDGDGNDNDDYDDDVNSKRGCDVIVHTNAGDIYGKICRERSRNLALAGLHGDMLDSEQHREKFQETSEGAKVSEIATDEGSPLRSSLPKIIKKYGVTSSSSCSELLHSRVNQNKQRIVRDSNIPTPHNNWTRRESLRNLTLGGGDFQKAGNMSSFSESIKESEQNMSELSVKTRRLAKTLGDVFRIEEMGFRDNSSSENLNRQSSAPNMDPKISRLVETLNQILNIEEMGFEYSDTYEDISGQDGECLHSRKQKTNFNMNCSNSDKNVGRSFSTIQCEETINSFNQCTECESIPKSTSIYGNELRVNVSNLNSNMKGKNLMNYFDRNKTLSSSEDNTDCHIQDMCRHYGKCSKLGRHHGFCCEIMDTNQSAYNLRSDVLSSSSDEDTSFSVTTQEEENNIKNIPLSLHFFFLTMYTVLGCVVWIKVFSNPPNTPANALYYTYELLSTTGFGDFIPSPETQLFTLIYGLVGLSMFNSMVNSFIEFFLASFETINQTFNVGKSHSTRAF